MVWCSIEDGNVSKKGDLTRNAWRKKRGGGGLVILVETVSMLYLCPFETVVVLKKKAAYHLNKKYVTLCKDSGNLNLTEWYFSIFFWPIYCIFSCFSQTNVGLTSLTFLLNQKLTFVSFISKIFSFTCLVQNCVAIFFKEPVLF